MENNFQINGFEYVENALQLDNEMLYPSQLNDIFGMLTGKIRKYSLSHQCIAVVKLKLSQGQ